MKLQFTSEWLELYQVLQSISFTRSARRQLVQASESLPSPQALL